jgi:molybdate transport system substrate-binding protein
MATKGLLDELAAELSRHGRSTLRFEGAGGVEVARMVRSGVAADLVVLSQEQLVDLDSDGLLDTDTLRPLFVSDVVAAVPAAAASRSLETEADLRSLLTSAHRVAHSTGPSGKAFLDLLRGWQLDDLIRDRLVEAAPGTPVGALLADGTADLGFQQRSELADLAGVSILGPLPGTAAISSIFSGAVLTGATNAEAAREALDFLASEDVVANVVDAGMARA